MFRSFLLVGCCALLFSHASEAASQTPYVDALAIHHYRYVEYPRQVRCLEDAIRFRKAEIASLQRRMVEWEPMDRFRDGRPLMVTIENTRLAILEARFDLAQLEQELFDLHRAHRLRIASFYSSYWSP